MTVDRKTIEKINKFHEEGYPFSQIGEKLNLSVNTVKKYLGRSKKETLQDTTQSFEIEHAKIQLEDTIFQTVDVLNSIPTEINSEIEKIINDLTFIWAKLDEANDINSITEIKKATDEQITKTNKIIQDIITEIEKEAEETKKEIYDKKYHALVNSLIHVLGEANELVDIPTSADEQLEVLDDVFDYKKSLAFPIVCKFYRFY